MMRLILSFTFIILAVSARAQEATPNDTLIQESRDTVLIQRYAARYNPRKALLYAAVVPGLGQIYNKKYWKLPLVYGGIFSIGYAINFYDGLYREFKHELFTNIELGIGEDQVRLGTRTTTRGYRVAVDKAKRERDFWIIMMGGMYLLQIIDAHVDTHLKEFDLNPRLQVRVEPTVEQNFLTGRQTGVAVIFRF